MSARFEYRIFSQELYSKKEYLEKNFKKINQQKTSEEYLLSKKVRKYNIKIRDNKLDVKKLKLVTDQFEQWDILFKKEFPILTNDINTLFNESLLENDQYISEFDLKTRIQQDKNMNLLKVDKKRVQFKKDTVLAEFAIIEFEHEIFHTIALESENLESLKIDIKKFGLDTFKNTNYYQFFQDRN